MLLRNNQIRRRLPNAITVARLILSGVFFGMLLAYRHGNQENAWWLFVAGWVFGLAAATDWVDGYLARRWQVVSVFGRIVDPFCDKILILGTFIFFASSTFLVADPSMPGGVRSLTGVGPVIVVLLLSRELLVTTIRGLLESSGQDYSARWSGKLKMILQSIAVPVVLVYVFALAFIERGSGLETAMRWLRDIVVWGTVIMTLWSVWDYIPRRMPAQLKS